MRNTLQKRVRNLRRLVTLSPRITVLSIIAMAVFLATVLLGFTVLWQAQAVRELLSFNDADVNRPFVQLQRESLRLLLQVKEEASRFDLKAFQRQRDLVESRFVVLHYPFVWDALPQESRNAGAQIDAMWANIVPLLDRWEANISDSALQQQLSQALVDMELLTNQTEIRYQLLRGETASEVGRVMQQLLLTLGTLSLVLAASTVLVAASIYIFVRERRKAEERAQTALAAEAAAHEANRFKDQFLATMSHELRTPLNAIIGFLGIMTMSKGIEGKNAHMVQRTRANAERLLTLINDILDLSKIESGRLELIPVAISPRNLVERWQLQMDVLARQKGLDFLVQIDPSVPDQVSIDEDAITKIVTNLLSNAFKFTEKGKVSLSMKAENDRWIIEVQDSGIGIPAHMHHVIFEAFRQVDGSSRRAYGGTGLGLSIVERLCKAMNGTIRLVSAAGEGSTFIVTLPLNTVVPEIIQERRQEVLS